MQPAEFLRLVVPEGVRFIARPLTDAECDRLGIERKGKYRPFAHYDHTADASAAAQAVALSQKFDVYHACAAYAAPEIELGGKKRKRVKENVAGAKSFFVDLDVGEGKPYTTQADAIKSLGAFCKALALPMPTVWVDSGYGVHAYWTTNNVFARPAWERTAELLRACLDHAKVGHDPTRTCDIASILRTPGTVNHKRGGARPVRVIGKQGAIVDANLFTAQLLVYQTKHALSIKDRAVPPAITGINTDLVSEVEYAPKSIVRIAEACRQVRDYRDSLGRDATEPLWRGILGLCKHTVEGLDAAQQWSVGHPDYDAADTEAKYAAYGAGPPTCGYFAQHNAAACAGCPHAGKIKSPIQLGHLPPEHVEGAPAPAASGESAVPQASASAVASVTGSRPFPQDMLDNWRWTGETMTGRLIKRDPKSGAVEETWEAFTTCYLKGCEYARAADGAYYMHVEHLHRGRWRKFLLPCALVGAGGNKLHETLGANLVTTMTSRKPMMEGYLQTWLRQTMKEADEKRRFQQYGWTPDNEFLVGNRLYRADGAVEEVLVGGDAESLAPNFAPRGDLDAWKRLIDRAYNYDAQEQYQFMLGVGFGAPLFKLLVPKGGATIHAMTPQTAEGKTTVAKAALSVWGDPNALLRTHQQATRNALYTTLGVMGNLPMLVDEVTNVKSIDISSLLYDISTGAGKTRSGTDGTLRSTSLPWTTLVLTTGNRSLATSVGTGKMNAEAEIARLVEFQFHSVSQLAKAEADNLFDELAGHYGLAGDVFIRYVVSNREKVAEAVRKVQRRLDQKAGVGRRERYWSAAAACVIAGTMIAKALGLVQFDTDKLLNWTAVQIRDMRKSLGENTADFGEAWGLMLAELSSSFITTETMGDSRNGKSVEVKRIPVGAIVGRTVVSEKAHYVNQQAVRTWCTKNQVDFNGFIQHAVDSAIIATAVPVKISLGRGTQLPAMQTKCYRLDREKIAERDAFLDPPVTP